MSQPLCYCIYLTLDSGHRKLLKRPKQRDLSCNSAMSTYFALRMYCLQVNRLRKEKYLWTFFHEKSQNIRRIQTSPDGHGL